MSGRRSALTALLGVVLAVSAVVVLARLGQLDSVLRRVEHANPALLGIGVGLELLSFAGYVVLTRIVFRPAAPRISWSESIQITLAGVVATRLLTAAGAGGIALTAWALRAAGLDARTAARRLAAFLVVLYGVFFVALLTAGAASATGALDGGVPRGLALAAAALAALVIAAALLALLVPGDIERRARRAAAGAGRMARLASRLATAPAVAGEAMRLALVIVCRRPAAVAAALAWWGFDVALLWTTFRMFGAPPGVSVLVLCYFLGQLAQALPVPGGIGPVEGGLIGAFVASGVALDLAIVSVRAYQALSTWLPVVPGLWGYWRLRGTVAGWRAANAAEAYAQSTSHATPAATPASTSEG